MPLIRTIDDLAINFYGSSHSHEEIPLLEDFFQRTAPRSLYLEVTPNLAISRQSRQDLSPDFVFCLEYAERNGIEPRLVGYSQRGVYRLLAVKYPLAVVVDNIFHLFNELVTEIVMIQDNPQYEVPQETQKMYHRLINALQHPDSFVREMQQTFKSLASPIVNEYVRQNLRSEVLSQAKETIERMDQYIRAAHSNIVNKQTGFPLEEEAVLYAIEADKEGHEAMGLAAQSWTDYKRDWLKESNTIMWKNTKPTLKKDPKPIDIVLGYQHLPFIEGGVRTLIGQGKLS